MIKEAYPGGPRQRGPSSPLISQEDKMPSNPIVNLETSKGLIRLELWPQAAPVTTENFLTYVKEGFYDGLIFHRVIPSFMVQAGGFAPGMEYRDPTHPTIQNEAANGKKNLRGTVAMARAYPINSAAAQFFINLRDNANLDHRSPDPQGYGYAVFGHVTDGMDAVDAIAAAPTATRPPHQNVPQEDIVIQRAWVEE
jgi:cyclophilin family peptidyl-prolyl cis-trans isomerase